MHVSWEKHLLNERRFLIGKELAAEKMMKHWASKYNVSLKETCFFSKQCLQERKVSYVGSEIMLVMRSRPKAEPSAEPSRCT